MASESGKAVTLYLTMNRKWPPFMVAIFVSVHLFNILVFVFLVLELIIVRVGADLCALFWLDELDVGEDSAAAQGHQQQDQHQGATAAAGLLLRLRFRLRFHLRCFPGALAHIHRADRTGGIHRTDLAFFAAGADRRSFLRLSVLQ